MIACCDTSALVKLYIVEPDSDAVAELAAGAEAVAVCRIAWAEAHAALSRRAREIPVDRPAIEAAKQALARDWPDLLVLEVTQALVERAGEYADVFGLRAYDSVQLAAAYEAHRLAETPVAFLCFDSRLNKAARVLGMSTPFGGDGGAQGPRR